MAALFQNIRAWVGMSISSKGKEQKYFYEVSVKIFEWAKKFLRTIKKNFWSVFKLRVQILNWTCDNLSLTISEEF